MRAHSLILLSIAPAAFTLLAIAETAASHSLEELRIIARSVHPTLDSATAAVEAAAGTLRQARAYPNPEVVLGIGRGRAREGGASRSENTIQLQQPLEMPGLRRWRVRSAQLRVRGVELDRVLAETVVDSTVTRLVYGVLLAQRRAEIAGESAEVASRLHELLTRRVEFGESSPLEAAKARSEWFARRSDVVQAESALVATRSALKLFCGDRLSAGYRIAETLEGAGAIALPLDLVERLRTHSPILLRAEIAVEEAQARTEVAKQEIFPRLDVFAGHEAELDRTATSVGIGLTIPLWNRNRGGIDAASAEHVRRTADIHAQALELERSLEQTSAAYRGALAAIRLHQDGWTATARQALDIATFSFENGEASLLDVLDAQRSYLGVRSAEAESWAALSLAKADLELLLAGPLESENTDEAE